MFYILTSTSEEKTAEKHSTELTETIFTAKTWVQAFNKLCGTCYLQKSHGKVSSRKIQELYAIH